MPRKRSQAELLSLVGQMSLFNQKLYEHHFIARAKFDIIGQFTRNAIKILLADIQEDDTEFRRLFIPREQLWGGMKRRNSRNNEKLTEEEAKRMSASTLLVRKLENPKSFKVYNFFDGLIEYDDEKKGIWAQLNPHLAGYYLSLQNNMTVLQRDVYFALSESFHKDLYEFILGCQDKKDINAFFRPVDWLCEHFGLAEHYKTNGHNLAKKFETAVNTIYNTMEIFKEDTQFSIFPRYAKTGEGKKNNGKLLGFDFSIEKAHGFTRQKDIPQYKQTAYLQEQAKKKQAADAAAAAAKNEEDFFRQEQEAFEAMLANGYFDEMP